MTTQYKITRADLKETHAPDAQWNPGTTITDPKQWQAQVKAEAAPANPANAQAASAHTPKPRITAGGFHHVDCQCLGCMKLRFNEAKASHEKALKLASYLSDELLKTQCRLSETAVERDRLMREVTELKDSTQRLDVMLAKAYAERDNLQQSLTRLQMAVMHGQRWGQALDENDRLERDATYLRETKDQWVRQCDQAREQVKTLLKACKQAIAIISQPVTQDRQRSIPETGHAYRILRDDVAIAAQQLNKAIANAESEQAK